MSALTVATVAGNAGVLSALRRARRSPQHYPLASLAAADLLVGVVVLPLAAARELFTFRLNWIICACWSTFDVLCCTASILSLCALGWERWSGITEPLALAKRAKWAKLLAIIVWPIATAVALPTAFIKSPGKVEKACTVNINPSYVFFSVSLSFYLPTCTMLIQYGQILHALSSRPRLRAHRGQGPRTGLDELKICLQDSTKDTSVCLAVKDHSDLSGPGVVRSPVKSLTPVRVPHTPIRVPHTPIRVPHTPVRVPHTPIRVPHTPIRVLQTPIRDAHTPIKVLQTPIKFPDMPTKVPHTPTKFLHTPTKVPLSPIKVPHTPIKFQYSPGVLTDRQWRPTIRIIRLMSLFLICWSPFFIMLPIDSLCQCVRDSTWQWCTWLGYTNSALNPVVYAAAATRVRRVIRAIIKMTHLS